MTTIVSTPTPTGPPRPRPAGATSRHSSTSRDVGLVFSRGMRLSLRNPVWLVMGLAQPLLYLFFFGPLLTRISGGPGFPPGRPVAGLRPGPRRDARAVRRRLRRVRADLRVA